jgi:hypothetical protein
MTANEDLGKEVVAYLKVQFRILSRKLKKITKISGRIAGFWAEFRIQDFEIQEMTASHSTTMLVVVSC